ncbi:MAG: aspartate/glutamate racemase family protein [Sphingomonadales bacterium]|nr:aspartate/glutamate racemase family protein [Sphingomonadales bacterium]
MRSHMKNRIRLIVPIITQGLRTEAHAAALGDDDTEISFVTIDNGPETIEGEFDEVFAKPDTVAKIIQAEQDGVDAVIIDCMGDPGLAAAREAVAIPVLGPCQTAMHVASMLGHRFSVVTVLCRLHPLLDNLASIYGVSGKMTSVRSVDIPVIELDKDPERLCRALAEQSIRAIEDDGADVIILGCTGMDGLADAIENELMKARLSGVPVIDPINAAISLAKALLRSKLSHSKRAFGYPRRKKIKGFNLPTYGNEE